MYPPLALLVGWYFDKAWSENRFSVLKWSAAVLTILAGILETGLLYAGKTVMSELYFPGMIMAVVFVVVNVLVWWLSVRREFRRVFAANVVVMLFFSTYLVTQLLPVIAPVFSMKSFVEEFNQHYDGQSQVYVAKFYRPGFMFYSNMPGKEITDYEEFTVLLGKNADAFFIVKAQEYRNLPVALLDKVVVLAALEDKILLVQKGTN